MGTSPLRYREPNHARSAFELAITAGAFVALWVVMWVSLSFGYWLTLVVAVPVAGFLVHRFMIQHDCSHGAFFGHRLANDWAGRAIGALTLTLYQAWRRSNAIHHASSGHLERLGISDIDTMTVEEYLESGRWVTVSIATPSSFLAWVRPIFSSCSTGCRTGWWPIGVPGLALWPPTQPSR